MSSKYRLLLIAILALLVYVSQISIQGMSPGEVTPDQGKITQSATPDGTDGVQNLDVSNAVLSFTQQATICPGDFDDNGMVNIADFLLFVGVFGTSSGDANYSALMDMDGNDEIGIPDFLLFANVFGTTCETPPPLPTSDRAVLVALYNATDGPNWKNNTNWLTDAPLRDWYGVEVDDAGRVVRLDLSGRWNTDTRTAERFGLSGPIPLELSNLENLTVLSLGYNNLTGSIPPELGNLEKLEVLRLYRNDLSSNIPPELGNLKNLRILDLYDNSLSGNIPPELFNLINLTRLNLGANPPYKKLSGPIPPEFSNLKNLTYLNLRYQSLAGPIPSELGNLAKLEHLDLGGNHLSGSIPPELGKLENLRYLVLQGRVIRTRYAAGLRGSIPPELFRLGKLRVLDLTGNDLAGPIPSELGNLAKLEYLTLGQNEFSGHLPSELGQLANLNHLTLWDNSLTGSLPPNFTNLPLEWLRIDGNDGLCAPGTRVFADWLEGFDSRRVAFCSESDAAVLKSLYEVAGGPGWTNSSGWLEGPVLAEWHGVLTDSEGLVTALDMSQNGLAGALPPNLGRLDRLTDLHIADNAGLSGNLPPSLSDISIKTLQYDGTGLCNPAEAYFQDWLQTVQTRQGTETTCAPVLARDVLEKLYLTTGGQQWQHNDNWLSERPLHLWHGVETDDAGRVIELDLYNNNLTGEIPPELGNLAHLKVLNLGFNSLSGPVPRELARLGSLESLDFISNKLSGRIPPEFGHLLSLRQLDLRGNIGIVGTIPPELSDLANLEVLELSGCAMTGSIPVELGDLTSLKHLSISGPAFSGTIPTELGRLTELESLEIRWTNLRGSIPPELGQLAHLRRIDLSSNEFTGSIPSEFGNLSSLEYLDFSSNDLTGSIPSEFGNLSNLEHLDLTANELMGLLPPELGRLASLERLYIAGNALSGSVPPEFGGLAQLNILVLSANSDLVGALPASITHLGGLESLQASGTELCAPSVPNFHEWLAGISRRKIKLCGGEAKAYLTQAVQSREFPVPLVAGKEALLRVFTTAARANEEPIPPVRASFYLDGALAHVTNIPASLVQLPTQVDEGSLAASANAMIPAEVVQPGLEMVIEINPGGTLDHDLGVSRRIPESGRAAIEVKAMPVLDLTVVPFIWINDPDSGIVASVKDMAADPGGNELLFGTRVLLPVGDMRVTAHRPVLTSSTETSDLLRETVAIRVMEGADGHYLGTMAPNDNGFRGGGRAHLPGRASFAAPVSDVITHELGHNMSLQHAPCGGPDGVDPEYPYRDGTIGVWGYDPEGRRLVSPDLSDLMSYCDPAWVSEYSFEKALRFRLADEGAGAPDAATSASSLLLWGGIDAEENPYMDPAFVVNAPPALPQSGGQYRITGRNATRTELFSLAFDMPEVADGDGSSSFAFVLPVDPEWKDKLASITLTGPGGSFTLDSDTDRPMVILRNPRSGQVRGFLHDIPGDAMVASKIAIDALSSEPGLEALFSRGIPGAEAYQQ